MNKFIISFFLILFNTISWAFNMSPDGFGKRVDQGAMQEYTFENNTGKTIRYRFKINPGTKGKSMHEWIEFEPKNMTIKNKESKKLKIFVKSPKGTPEGDYNFYLGVETINVPTTVSTTKDKSVGAGATVGLAINVEMLGWVGELPAQLNLENYSFYEKSGMLYMKGVINNKTPKRFVKYMIDITNNNGIRETFFGGVINAKEIRNIEIPLPKFKKKNEIWKIEVKETLDRNLLQSIIL
ncbi:hypothetical protein [Cetobacterium sp.]|uniref:hypothetical protein n=1 Tax=Cetobacterium sp. TaxID=2071632 RepID=UPI003AF1A9AC